MKHNSPGPRDVLRHWYGTVQAILLLAKLSAQLEQSGLVLTIVPPDKPWSRFEGADKPGLLSRKESRQNHPAYLPGFVGLAGD